jgi:hypothetical protein
MPQRVCRETVRIVQEGLVNVRKHSGVRRALVSLGSTAEQWNLRKAESRRFSSPTAPFREFKTL